MARGQVRIIAGEWRGRKLEVPDLSTVRPTPDRVRVTLFNWLQALVPGARCLDLFAGSGVLGFEALSRGASEVVFVDQSAVVVQLLKEQLLKFKAQNASVYQATLPKQWPTFGGIFDLVFLDPPYDAKLLIPICFALEDRKLLAEQAYIYLESGEAISEANYPLGWKILKEKKAGQVFYYLLKKTGVSHDNLCNS